MAGVRRKRDRVSGKGKRTEKRMHKLTVRQAWASTQTLQEENVDGMSVVDETTRRRQRRRLRRRSFITEAKLFSLPASRSIFGAKRQSFPSRSPHTHAHTNSRSLFDR